LEERFQLEYQLGNHQFRESIASHKMDEIAKGVSLAEKGPQKLSLPHPPWVWINKDEAGDLQAVCGVKENQQGV
jgi:hypothetical protein